jgi:hypothetical protein
LQHLAAADREACANVSAPNKPLQRRQPLGASLRPRIDCIRGASQAP